MILIENINDAIVMVHLLKNIKKYPYKYFLFYHTLNESCIELEPFNDSLDSYNKTYLDIMVSDMNDLEKDIFRSISPGTIELDYSTIVRSTELIQKKIVQKNADSQDFLTYIRNYHT